MPEAVTEVPEAGAATDEAAPTNEAVAAEGTSAANEAVAAKGASAANEAATTKGVSTEGASTATEASSSEVGAAPAHMHSSAATSHVATAATVATACRGLGCDRYTAQRQGGCEGYD